jgi:hypothetical protein
VKNALDSLYIGQAFLITDFLYSLLKLLPKQGEEKSSLGGRKRQME